MTRLTVLVLSALIAAAPLSVASAQDRGDRSRQGPERSGPSMGAAEASSIAQSRALAQLPRDYDPRKFRSYGLQDTRGSSYVFRFEYDGRVFDIVVDGR